ncbi:ferrous iron transporter B, partial [bacterium]|nr:ferrous iron transporter B [bacterium]
FETVKKSLHEHPKVSEDISITRYGTAAFIAEKVTQITRLGKEKRLQYKIDNVLLHETWGPVLTLLSFSTLFGVLLFIGSLVQEALLGFTESILSPFLGNGPVVGIIASQALYGAMAGISIALPYVFLFYLLLGLMEDVGILPRFVVNLERFLRRLNLPGKSLIPLILGLGCTVPAVRATRVLSCKKKRFCTASFFTFVPCSSRIAIIMGVVGYYGGMLLSLLVFATLLVSALIWAFIMKKLVRPEITPLILELPPYRKPSIKNIAIKSWIRMKDFVYIVIPLLAIGGAVYAVLDITGVTNIIAIPLSPLAWWLGLPPLTIIPIVFGFLQKDLTGAMLLSVLGTEIGSVLSPLQIYTFGVATTI